jgi:hypothetical protein
MITARGIWDRLSNGFVWDRMTKTVLWIMICMAFSVILVVHESRKRDQAIAKATERAVVLGLYSGCEELTLPTRRAVNVALTQVENDHPTLTTEVYFIQARKDSRLMNCRRYATRRGAYFKLLYP